MKEPRGIGYGEEPLPVPHGAHNGLKDSIRLADLIAPGAVGSATGRQFCAQLRRDSFVPLVLTAAERALLEKVECGASAWFTRTRRPRRRKCAYGHVDRKLPVIATASSRAAGGAADARPGARRLPLPRLPPALGTTCVVSSTFWTPRRGASFGIAEDVTSGGDDGFLRAFWTSSADLGEPEQGGARATGKENAAASMNDDTPPSLGHSLIRLCRYDADSEGVYGSHVLCEQHNDVGFITLDACASVAGLEAFRRADGLWVPVEHAPPPPNGELILLAMVGDTLGRLTANYYAPCKHRVVQPPPGLERIGLPFLFRGRSDAVLNTQPTRESCKARGSRPIWPTWDDHDRGPLPSTQLGRSSAAGSDPTRRTSENAN